MEERTLVSFRELLVTRLSGLLNGGSGPVLKHVEAGFAETMDLADLASHHCDQELLHTARHRNQLLAQEIQFAIKRIDEGDFGVCWLCSSSIGIERLQARPTAYLCIRCQRTLESLKRRRPAA